VVAVLHGIHDGFSDGGLQALNPGRWQLYSSLHCLRYLLIGLAFIAGLAGKGKFGQGFYHLPFVCGTGTRSRVTKVISSSCSQPGPVNRFQFIDHALDHVIAAVRQLQQLAQAREAEHLTLGIMRFYQAIAVQDNGRPAQDLASFSS
jgi:hypothetical protein